MARRGSWTQRVVLLASAAAAVALLALPDGQGPGEDDDQASSEPGSSSADGLLPIDESFFGVAAASGGDFYFWEPGEFARASGLVVPIGSETILVAHGRFQGTRTFEFPVDGLTTRLELVLGAQGLADVEVIDGAGASLRTSTTARLQAYRRMRLASVDDPAPGVWSIQLTGEGFYSVSVRTLFSPPSDVDLEAIELISARFVEPGGRPGHEGLFPVHGDVGPGETRLLSLHVSGSHASFEPVFFGGEGERLEVDWAPGPDTGETDERIFQVVVPSVPFRIGAKGSDALGLEFQRAQGSLTTPLDPGGADEPQDEEAAEDD